MRQFNLDSFLIISGRQSKAPQGDELVSNGSMGWCKFAFAVFSIEIFTPACDVRGGVYRREDITEKYAKMTGKSIIHRKFIKIYNF